MKKEPQEEKLDKLIEEGKLKLREINTELKTSEDRYHRMIEEVEDYAIILLDEKGIIQKWNKGAEKIKLYSEKEIVGKSFRVFYLPEDQNNKLPETLLNEAKAADLPVAGLMCLPPAGVEAAPYFALLAKLARAHGLVGLSMGMSDDFETAAMLGATHVRVGSALFGVRG